MNYENKIQSITQPLYKCSDGTTHKDLNHAIQREARLHQAELLSTLFVDLMRANPHAIDMLAPLHSRTSCSDGNPENPTRCERCTLIEYRKNGWLKNQIIDISFDKLENVS